MMESATLSTTVTNWQGTPTLCFKRSIRPRVLIVDDDRDLCELMAQLLAADGFETDVAVNGQEALDRALDNPPRVIVLDMVMPVMDGWAFRAQQRHCITLAAIPVIIMSAVPPARLLDVGVAAAVQKPFLKDELIAAVRAYC
jgi:DNA-binding response OmpR family regulator